MGHEIVDPASRSANESPQMYPMNSYRTSAKWFDKSVALTVDYESPSTHAPATLVMNQDADIRDVVTVQRVDLYVVGSEKPCRRLIESAHPLLYSNALVTNS